MHMHGYDLVPTRDLWPPTLALGCLKIGLNNAYASNVTCYGIDRV